MHFKLLAALSTWSMMSGVLGDAMSPRILQQCVLMNRQQRIICHGGTTAGTDVWNHFSPTADFFQLNVSTPLSPSDAGTGWTPMPTVPDFALEARAEFGMTAVNDSRIVIISGAGPTTSYTHAGLVNVTVWYDTETNTFGRYDQSNIPIGYDGAQGFMPFNITPVQTQMQGVGACTRLKNNTQTTTYPILVNGGLRLDNPTLIGDFQISDYVGIIPNTSDWNQINIIGVNSPRATFGRTFREVSVRTVDDKIIYLGGMQWNFTTDAFYNGVDNTSLAVPMNYIFFEDLATGYFNTSMANVFGNNKPSSPTVRYWHTATELPGHKVFMYGGAFQGVAVRDYAYILDTNTLLWSQVQFPQVNDNSCSKPGAKCGGPRFGHSAILVNNELLYIMFGANDISTLLNDTLILNTTSMMWLDSSVTTSVNNGQENSSSTPASNGLSGGAIAGIVVGVVVGVGAIVGAAVFFALKKRNQRDAVPAPPEFFNQDMTSGYHESSNMMPPQPQSPQWTQSQTMTQNSWPSSPNHTVVKPFSAN